jgi:hypothetical protein
MGVDEFTHVYCYSCKLIRPAVRSAFGAMRTRSGRAEYIRGEVACAKCDTAAFVVYKKPRRRGDFTHVFCELCDRIRPVERGRLFIRSAADHFISRDVSCGYCRFVIATVFRLVTEKDRAEFEENALPRLRHLRVVR